ncbi:hypothetical protein BGLT_06190 [Caballeronia glathei]|uniref:Uncharacterized protein n=1 Tax=Caballeronia glathei TaxID=60547 RepID=A0A069PM34_9BURK|nr:MULTISPECIES: hypothetical protein [Burkholderiaceae]KDR41497.1 hypothetical protein BG61_17555 [Caballeronia glathei]TCK36434.1 hypothetical protein B0G84_5438 [Paraburkholderia sp. BL8N3]CDY77278.1 hypothetical protein BGLT_06190 [Caballeronia glathei]
MRATLSRRLVSATWITREMILAYRIKERPPARSITEEVRVGLVDVRFGPVRMEGPFNHQPISSGTRMEAILGPDASNVSRQYVPGTRTNGNSLREFMTALVQDSYTKDWKAGHLLNEELGGDGQNAANLTPLTSKANSAHKSFESHIKRMLLQCHRIDREDKACTHWYGVEYKVQVSHDRYSAPFDADLIDSYVALFISIEYKYIKIEKARFPFLVKQDVAGNDPKIQTLTRADPPVYSSTNVKSVRRNGIGTEFFAEIHNQD